MMVSDCTPGEGTRIDSFALVTYIPGPLGLFLNQLRRDLEPVCRASSHVTILPPRPLGGPPEEAWRQLEAGIAEFSPFELELTGIELFSTTNVIYVAIGAGYRRLEEMHDALGGGRLSFLEPFHYHPHVTVAQELLPNQIPDALAYVERRWSEYKGARHFGVESLTFVQNTLENCWINLSETRLKRHDESLVRG